MKTKKRNLRWDTMRILAGGFLGTIFLGAFLLWLPICNNEPITFLDSLFTSTTAVCVTGLVTIVPATQFTLLGKVILLLLIQIGGLGIIACTTGFFILIKKKITISERVIISETYSSDGPGGMVKMVRRAVLGTFFVEAVGAAVYACYFIPHYGVVNGIGYSVFHSISAFCNAGIDILGSTSFAEFVHNPLININTMLLIILGGIGFIVWFDIVDNGKRIRKHEVPKKWWFTRLNLHSKIALTTTAIMLVAGTLAILFFEYNNPETMGKFSVGDKIMSAAFQSVTTRTAGYFTLPQNVLHNETKLFGAIWMFIGGSPGGTAGGIKTTTIAMLVLTAIAVIRGGEDTECFGRKISKSNFRTGFAVSLLAMIIYLVGTMAIVMIESDSVPVIDIIYETASASGTVGLTANLTPNLQKTSQIVLIGMMYLGRIGPLTFALVFGGRRHAASQIRELPERNILVG